MKTPNIDAVKQIPAFEVGQTLNLIHQQVKNLSPKRWAFIGSNNATYLEFFNDGSYRDHKRGVGGSCIDLVMQTLCSGNDHDQRYFMDASRLIAAHYGFWHDTGEFKEAAKKIAIHQGEYSTVHNYLRAALKNVTADHGAYQNGWSASMDQVERFLGAIELDRHQITWGTILQKTQSLGFSPAVPWQGKPHHEKLGNDGKMHPFGGWTKELATNFSNRPEALKLFCVDIDGDGNKKPLLKLILRLVNQLKKKGVPPRVFIISSWFGDKNADRVKVHLYFVAKRRAQNPDVYKYWHEHLESIIGDLIGKWLDVEDGERAALQRDHATHNISRIMRVPGISKYGHDHAASIYEANDGAIVDFEDVIQTSNISISYGNRRYEFGEKCVAITTKVVDDAPQDKYYPFAKNLWPLKNFRRVESGETGVMYRYHTRSGHIIYGSMDADAFTNKSKGQKAVSEASLHGAQVRPESENTLATALGFWTHVGMGPSVNMVSTPGWHRDKDRRRVYVNGTDIHGADDWEVDRDAEAVKRRDTRAGTLGQWRSLADSLVTTYGLALALGQSLAGPLIELLDLTPYTIHLCGFSSHGKSTAARVAGSIWGHPRYTFQSWDVTNVGIEIAAETANGGCLVLDELKRFGDDRDRLSRVVYGLNSTQGRLKANQNSELAKQRTWRLATISTGEFSLFQFLGDKYQGGHGVRFLDVPTRPGDLTKDKEHAKALDRMAYNQYGIAGNAWIKYLCDAQVQKDLMRIHRDWLDTVGSWSENPETMRICDNLAVIGTALTLAGDTGLTAWQSDSIRDVLKWCLELMTPDRTDGGNPNERAYAMLKRWFLVRPDRFPKANDATRSRNVIGYSEREDTNEQFSEEIGPTRVYTTYTMMKASDLPLKSGVQAKPWLDWCLEKGYAVTDHGKILKGNQRQRWLVFQMDEYEATEDYETGEVNP